MIRPFMLGATLIATALSAQAGQMQSLQASVAVTQKFYGVSAPLRKDVFLMKLDLSPRQLQKLFTDGEKSLTTASTSPSNSHLPAQAELSMNGVPVLDQGNHGSCVTFASTAAIDALIGKGDYISQLCNLELGSYIAKRSYGNSGWDGAFAPAVLAQIETFGIISKEVQKSKSCAGVRDYPLYNEYNTGNPMSLDEFKQSSEKLAIYQQPVLSLLERFDITAGEAFDVNKTLEKVKTLIAHPNKEIPYRLLIATILPYKHCSAGACAHHHATDDTWAMTNEIIKDKDTESVGGHEMIIVGYDDNAVATDRDGRKHKGLLKLRNSWSASVGDKGNYYMSYDYFKYYVMAVDKINLLPEGM